MSQHTPEPWECIFRDYRGAFDPMVMGSDEHEICYVYKHRQDQSVTIANANLIAKAPELYDELNHTYQLAINGECNLPFSWMERVGALLKKTRGEE